MATISNPVNPVNPKNYPVARPPGQEHIPLYPTGFIAFRIAQLSLAVLILALAAYGISVLSFDGDNLIMAVAILCMLTSIYQIVAHYGPQAAYNYWAILGLDIFNLVMWLTAFALLASEVAPYLSAGSTTCNYLGRCTKTALTGERLTLAATQMTAAALGGVEFILYVTTLVVHSIRLHRHRAAGLHCMPPSANPGPGFPPTTGKPGGLPTYQQYQQPVPAYLQHTQQQMYPPAGVMHPQGYYAPHPQPQPQPQGYPPVAGLPPQQYQVPPQQQQHQQQQHHVAPPQMQMPQTFYAPVPVHPPHQQQHQHLPQPQQQHQQQQSVSAPSQTSGGSPAPVPPAQLVPQATGGSLASGPGLGQGQRQGQEAAQLPAN